MQLLKRVPSAFLVVVVGLTSHGDGSARATTLAPVPARSAVPAPAVVPAPVGQMINATPTDYLSKVRGLKAGDTLVLAAGTYDDPGNVPGLPVFNLNGTASAPITITGASDASQTVLLGRSTHNTIRFSGSSYVIVKNLTVDGRDLGGDAVSAQGVSHHITIENLIIRGVGSNQAVVGISTNGAATWNWTIRGNTIIGAGTGMYLGNSDGARPFVAGLIERNVIRDTIGYNVQIKHQAPWPNITGLPTGKTNTVVRHNVFTKGSNSSTGADARPNLLIGDVPASGPGADNGYEVYGNFFYQNPTEALFQAEGNVAFYANLLVSTTGSAVHVQRHNGAVRAIRIFGNTVVAAGGGISVTGGNAPYTQQVVANAVFAATPISAHNASANFTGTYANAARHLNNPTATIGQLDLFPKTGGTIRGAAAIDTAGLSAFTDWALDFNGKRRDWSFRGAYSGEGVNSGWRPKIEIKAK